jgi:2-hydroxychromene-2-carboxylate isomerase
MRMLTGLQMRSDARMHEFMDVIYKAIWVDALSLNDPEVVEQVLREAHYDAKELVNLANEQETKDRHQRCHHTGSRRRGIRCTNFFCWPANVLGSRPDRTTQVSNQVISPVEVTLE